MAHRKRIIKVASVTAVTGGVVSFPSDGGEQSIQNLTTHMDVIVNVVTLAGGTSPTVDVTVQEEFSDLYITTGDSGSLNATGAAKIPHEIDGTQAAFKANCFLGKGVNPRINVAVTGSPTGLQVDVYAVIYDI